MIENTVNQLFCELIGGPHYQLKDQQNRVFVGLLLTYTLDLRKKLHLTNAILKNRGIDESKMFKRLHQLHDLRNVLCHFPFEQGEDRLTCETAFSKKPAISERDDEITYAEFDFYDALASDLYEKLQDLLDSAYPITDYELQRTMAVEIEKAISASDNVLRFPEKPQLDDDD